MSILDVVTTPGSAHEPAEPPRRARVTALPVLILFPHARCNCRCVMCDIWKETKKTEISPESAARLLPEWRALGVAHAVLSGGEPLMHSDLFALARLLREAGIALTLLSTGLLLSRDARAIVETFSEVVVSLDGPREIHDAVRRVPRAFDRLAEGVKALRDAGATMPISARSTVQRRNFRRLRGTVDAAREIGVDRVSFLAVDAASDAFNRPEGVGEAETDDLVPSLTELPELEAELLALETERSADFAAGFIAESPEKLRRDLLDHFRAVRGFGAFPVRGCNAPWVSAVVEADGTVRPCFFHPPLGRVEGAATFESVLNSETAVAFREALDVSTNPICRRCVCRLNLRGGA